MTTEETSSSTATSQQQAAVDIQQQRQNDAAPAAPIKPATPSSPAVIKNNQKIKVHLVAVGSAPILKKNKFLMNRTDNFGVAISFLRKRLKLNNNNTSTSSSSSLFLYVNSAFVPCPTEQIGDLYDCFGMREELVIHYSLQEAWG
ncbi:ubiquitin-like protein ATG12 [Skeletonema marinoi]|uniref:Ubiquitin-like protein ATG12 n=1 Tax=Skeletonema marinoi TaxID=267567 RepID=A0AAD8YBT5_9STRA|nr:ubiquitin-like protein ATG12 [Skeletonema marinoi]